jgi:rSAM/selenodomain-associated transferase 1
VRAEDDDPRNGGCRAATLAEVSRCLVVVTRAPGLATAKTRLADAIGAEACKALQRAFLADTVAWARELAPLRVLSVHPPGAVPDIAAATPGWAVVPQTQGDFGGRMRGAVNAGFAAGGASVAMIATDSPTLPPELVEDAFARLARAAADVAVGPAEDGGWVLIAAREPLPEACFQGVRWSARQTLEDTERALRRMGLKCERTESWYDVDSGPDLERLAMEMRAGAAARLPHTAGALEFMDWQYRRG